SKPRGSYQRRIGFLYEFLTGTRLPVEDTAKTNYVDLVDPEKYLTGKVEKASRWRINNNLLGTPEFCPVIRRTKQLAEGLSPDFQQLVRELTKRFPPEIFYRAVSYLYRKETKSSYKI